MKIHFFSSKLLFEGLESLESLENLRTLNQQP
jgi:hypothetical protein